MPGAPMVTEKDVDSLRGGNRPAHWSESISPKKARQFVKFDEIASNKPTIAMEYQAMLKELPEARRAALIQSNKVGRPSSYSDELAESLFERMESGETITQICRTEGFPAPQTILRWQVNQPGFAQRYAEARRLTADWHFNRVLEVAEDDSIEDVQRARLRVDVHKWYAEKLNPRDYGQQKQQVEISGSIDVRDTTLDVRALTLEQREMLKTLLIAARDGAAAAQDMKTIEHEPAAVAEDA